VAMALVLDLLASSERPLSRWVETLPRFVMIKDQYPLGPGCTGPKETAALWERIAHAYPEARSDRRDGLRLDWDERGVHGRSSNTEPIVRVIAEATEAGIARNLADQVGRWVSGTRDAQR
jgi:phosphomannomutase